MKTADILRRAGKNLRQAKGRTILTSLAIGVGAFTIALALAAGTGGRAYTEEMVNTSGDTYSLSVYPKPKEREEQSANNDLPEYGIEESKEDVSELGGLTSKDTKKLQAVQGVESVQPMLYVEPQYMTRGGEYKKRVATLSVKMDRTDMKLAAGALHDNMLRQGEAVIPEGFLSSFGFTDAQSAIGQTLYIHIAERNGTASRDVPFTIVAVDRPSDTVLYYEEAVRISPQDSKTLYEYQNGAEASQQYYGATVLVRRDANVRTVQQAIIDAGYQSYSLEDTREQLMSVINVAQWGLAGFGALAVLASIFGIINTQYISVLERTQQIGLMKALGARKRDIGRLFRYEAAWVGFLGGMIGVVLAFLVTLFNPLIAEALKLEEGTQLLRMDWLASGILVLALMLVAIMSGYFPSRKAAKLDPIEALRTE